MIRGLFVLLLLPLVSFAQESSYERFEILTASSPVSSRSAEWTPGKGIALEVSGMTWYRDKLAICIRKGEVWLLSNALSRDLTAIKYQLFASGLHEPLGLLVDKGDLLVGQRAEITRLKDRDNDGVADAYLTECDGWNVSGNYHAYTYGPSRDGDGNLWVTLNLGMGKFADNKVGWRGWGGTIGSDGRFHPKALGMRSPCGMGANLAGELFFSDQQGTWIPATPIYHLREGVFYGNQESLTSLKHPDAPFQLTTIPKPNQTYSQALASCKEFVPPAVWLPYNKMGRSATDIQVIPADTKFGPFGGQLLVGEFTNSAISRVFLEKVKGQYQGACFPFLDAFPAAVLRLVFAEDGSLFVGMSNRGWSSLGSRSYGLERVRFNGTIPFAIKEMKARRDGFELTFTKPVDLGSVSLDSFEMASFTYEYSSKYGGNEIRTSKLKISKFEVGDDGRNVRLYVSDLKPDFVHELTVREVICREGVQLEGGGKAYYTLNRIPD